MKLTPAQIRERKGVEPLTMLTCYDAMNASFLEQAGVDILLVGDSCANVFLGAKTTREITADRLAYHVEAVRNGAPGTHILADLDYNSSQTVEAALSGAQKLISAGADSIKFEGWHPEICAALNESGIPLVGHVGLLPQTAKQFRVHGKESAEADRMIADAVALSENGAFLIVAECIPSALGSELTTSVDVPVIGIGAGSDVDGQVLVLNDLLGMTPKTARFVRRYTELGEEISRCAAQYVKDVKGRRFPDESESYR